MVAPTLLVQQMNRSRASCATFRSNRSGSSARRTVKASRGSGACLLRVSQQRQRRASTIGRHCGIGSAGM